LQPQVSQSCLLRGLNILPAKETPRKTTKRRELAASHVGNITLRHRQNRFKNKRSNLNLLEELEESYKNTKQP